MLCDVCGRENPDNLTFCKDCGRRLKPSSNRIAPPTPPNGLPLVDLEAHGGPRPAPSARRAEPQTPDALAKVLSAPTPPPPITPPPPPRASRSRPEAPVFSFNPSAPPAPARGTADAAAGPPDEPPRAAGPTCGACGTASPDGYRFCVTCGSALPASSGGAPGRPQATTAASPFAPPAPRANGLADARADHPGSVVAAPVVVVAAPAAAQRVTCARCGGVCPPGSRFCKYCGAEFDAGERPRQPDAAPSPAPAPRPAPTAEAPAAPPRPASARPAPPVRPPQDPFPEAPAPLLPDALPDARARRAGPSPAGEPAALVPSRAAAGKLVVIVEDGSEGRSYPLSGRQLDIGRTEGEIALSDDLYVSPRHARLLFDGTRWLLRDLESLNHVYVRIRKPYPLRDGDLLLLGLEVLQFQAVSDAERGLGHATQHGTLLFGAPAVPRRARLCQRTVEGVTRDVYHLFRDDTVIGRETGDIVFTSDPFLSRRHAVIRRNPASGEFSLVDLDSSNGTFVAIRGEVPLSNGDFVRIGQHLFRVDLP